MNKLKVTVVLMLVLALVMGIALPALADTGSITVENPVAEHSYVAYRIFDVTYNSDGSSYAYTISDESEWLSAVQSYAGVTLTPATNTSNGVVYVVTANDTYSAADFATVLKSNVDDKTGTELAVANGKATATGLPLGYYFVTSSAGALCNLTTTDPSASIYDKNDVPFDKTDNREDVDVGEVVEYTITGKVPSTTGFNAYVYEVADTMSDGLTFQNDVKVYVAEAELAKEFYTLKQTPNGFTLAIDVMKLQDVAAQEIKVTYTAVVNEKAIASIEKNSATLKYSNDPTQNDSFTTTPAVEEKVYSSRIIIDKFAMNSEEKTALANAKFVLKNADGKFYQYIEPVADDPNTEAVETADGKVNWVDSQSDATEMMTDENGAAMFGGLADGEYSLIETEAPAGYNLLTEAVTITVNGSEEDETKLSVIAEVENQFGAVLPETGGTGTTLFYLIGGALVAGAFIMLVTRKRVRTEK